MGAYKEMTISDNQEEQIDDTCDHCSGEVHKGQIVWRVGSEVYCCREGFESVFKIVPMRF